MTSRFRLSRKARADLEQIGRYTARTWGKAQRDRYLAALYDRMAWLADEPSRGRPRDDITPGLHSYVQGTHLIFYVIRGKKLMIVGIPHQAMDLHAHFEGAAPE